MATCSPSAIKTGLQGLGTFVKKSGTQVIFSSRFPVEGSNTGRNTWAESINTWLVPWLVNILGVFWWNGLHSTRHAGIRWESSFSAREDSLC